MKKMTICGMIAAALMLTSCATSKVEETSVPNFEGAWEVEEFVKDGAVVTGATANLEIVAPKDGVYEIHGNDGVNSFFGSFNITADSIAPVDANAIGGTKKAGSPEAMAYEQAFLEVILATNNIALDGDKLVISNDTATITFVEGAPAAMPIEDAAEEDVPVIEE